jgi:short-subunit dehydrogenase
VESRRFKERVYEELAKERGVKVMHFNSGDVTSDLWFSKLKITVSWADGVGH